MISRLLEAATVVITSARPRALRQLGWLPRPGQTWITITGYGWDGTDQDRVGYGDEAAFAAGLIAGLPERPEYLADAIADPLTGMHAAVAALASLVSGVAAHVDVSLYSVCAHLGTALRGDRPRPTAELFSAPRRRPSRGRAAELGADNADVAGLL
jgi:crotonobetainyl-CoA:carnitine CoA-transferase CaiB-like acyl-CoA transferase